MVKKENSHPNKFCLKHLFKRGVLCSHILNGADSAEETTERIRLGALAEFSEHGYQGARMQSIADRAGVNKALLHYHFKNKDQLYLSIISEIEQIFWEGLTPIIEAKADTAKEFLQKFVAQVFETLLTHPVENQIFMQELASGGPFLKANVGELQDLCDSKVTAVIMRMMSYMEAGEIRQLDPVQLFLNIMSMCEGSFLLRPLIENSKIEFIPKIDRTFYEKRCEAIAEIIWHGVLNPMEEE